MKRIYTLIALLGLTMALTGCGGDQGGGDKTPQPPAAPAPTNTPPATK